MTWKTGIWGIFHFELRFLFNRKIWFLICLIFFRFMNFMKCLSKIWTVVSACNVMIYPWWVPKRVIFFWNFKIFVENISEHGLDLNLHWINILKMQDDWIPLLLNLFRYGDMCRDELKDFFRNFDVHVLPWEVLKNFELNMLCIIRAIYFYRNVAGVLREVSEMINMI